MAAANVESQRLITLSLGKIAQSRSQKGGINLHKNLLVATVLHKARTACMMEYQSLQRQRQLEFQQRQQQEQRDAAALEFETKQEQARSAALSLAAFNTSQQQQHGLIPTCVREMECQDQACDSHSESNNATTSEPTKHDSVVNVGQVSESGAAALASDTATASPALKVGHSVEGVSLKEQKIAPASFNKENSPPCVAVELDSNVDEFDDDFEEETAAQVVPQSSVLPSTPVDHLVAATQLAEDSASSPSRINQTSALPTCNVLKRQRDNCQSVATQEQECSPAAKRARLVTVPSYRSRRDTTSASHNPMTEADQHTSCSTDSNQISNLVSIFNSGFTGLCAVSQLSSSRNEEVSSSLDLSSSSENMSDQFSQSDSLSMSPSLSCSSSLGRIDSIPSALGLVLTV